MTLVERAAAARAREVEAARRQACRWIKSVLDVEVRPEDWSIVTKRCKPWRTVRLSTVVEDVELHATVDTTTSLVDLFVAWRTGPPITSIADLGEVLEGAGYRSYTP